MVAHRYDERSDVVHELWRKPYVNDVQMIVFAESGQLWLEDAGSPEGGSALVAVDILSGAELARTRISQPTLGMFLSPGGEGDLYAATLSGTIVRVGD